MLVLRNLGMSQGRPQELARQRQRAVFTASLTGRQRHREKAMVGKKPGGGDTQLDPSRGRGR